MKKILLIGENYSQNLGDGVICSVVNGLLCDKYEIEIIDLSGRTNYVLSSNIFDVEKEKITYLKSIIKKILSKFGYYKMGNNLSTIYGEFVELFDKKITTFIPDAILIAGGQMFIDTFVNQLDYIKEYCEERNIPMIFNSCGGGNILNKDMLRKILDSECVKYISVRDNIKNVQNYTSKFIFDTFDTAVLTNMVFKNSGKCDNSVLGVGIMFSTLQPVSKQIKFWKRTIKNLNDENISFKIFTNGSVKDYTFAKYLLNELNISNDHLLDKPNNPEDLIKEICSFNSILSMRLHSLIIAYSYNIPAVAISWDKKVDVFFEKIGRSRFCINLDIDTDKIINLIKISKNEKYDDDIRKDIIRSVKENIDSIVDIIK